MQSREEAYLILGGGGEQARAIAHLLRLDPDVRRITAVDIDAAKLAELDAYLRDPRLELMTADLYDIGTLRRLAMGHRVMINAADYRFGGLLLRLAIEAGCHYCDCGGNPDMVTDQFGLDEQARAAGIRAVPDTGIAPGGASILVRYGHDLLGGWPDRIGIYCGGMPQENYGPLGYSWLFSIQGLFNEYFAQVEALIGGKRLLAEPLSAPEVHHWPGWGKMVARRTSGGASTLIKSLEGKSQEVEYKTYRRPGHWEKILFMRDMGFVSQEPIEIGGCAVKPWDFSKAIFDKALPRGLPDMLLMRVIMERREGRRLERLVINLEEAHDPKTGLSAMQRTTGFSTAIIAKMMARGKISDLGVLRQEESVPAALFVEEWRKHGISIRLRRSGRNVRKRRPGRR